MGRIVSVMSRHRAKGLSVQIPPVDREERIFFTPEDQDRSDDRERVLKARTSNKRVMLLWLLVGPGLLVMLGENDGPSMLSYAETGARYGVGFFLPFILATFAAAYVVQEMAMRLGSVTHRGYGELIFQRFGPFWGWLSAIDLALTNLITLVTEIIAIRVGTAYFSIPAPIAVAGAILLLVISSTGSRYARWERISMGLAFFNLMFLVAAGFSHPSPSAIGMSLLTWRPLPRGPIQELLLLVASNVGATVTPWMLFFQQSASVDKGLTPSDLRQGRMDTLLGTIMAALAGCGALIAAATLYAHHVQPSNALGGTGYAEALKPFLGHFGAALFAIGLVEAGVVAMLTISASTAYAMGEAISGSGHSFNRSIKEAPLFHAVNIGAAVVAGIIVLIPGSPLLSISLNANLLATVLMPCALVFLLLMTNDRSLMGKQANTRLQNTIGIAISLFVIAAGSGYAVVSFFGIK
jgi:Mn2+/Fe2+ NRAMP family transporter